MQSYYSSRVIAVNSIHVLTYMAMEGCFHQRVCPKWININNIANMHDHNFQGLHLRRKQNLWGAPLSRKGLVKFTNF